MATNFDLVRWRSFAERYIVERARTFEVGRERDGIFLETQNALMAYQHIYNVGMVQEGKMPSTASVLGLREEDVKAATLGLSYGAGDGWTQRLLEKITVSDA